MTFPQGGAYRSDMPLRTYVNTDIDATAELLHTALDGTPETPLVVLLTPASSNTGTIYFGGDATVTNDEAATGGTPIPAGGIAVELCKGDALYVIASAANQKLRVALNGPNVS